MLCRRVVRQDFQKPLLLASPRYGAPVLFVQHALFFPALQSATYYIGLGVLDPRPDNSDSRQSYAFLLIFSVVALFTRRAPVTYGTTFPFLVKICCAPVNLVGDI